MTEAELIEELAHFEHASWARWMDYLFSKCTPLPDGSLVIPARSVEHWRRQTVLNYAELTEREKESDRREVRDILPAIRRYAGAAEVG